ncbi:MAG: hypothetical protein KAU90_01560 [Sulfurovaceae bacterium]|nr:hypothetical protein [Sulfurovaceae bacterium]
MTLGGYATYTYDINDKFYTRGKLGIAHRGYSWDNSYRSDYNEISVSAGIGAGIKLSNGLKVYSDFIMLDGSNLEQLNFGVQMNF